jgi:Putative DNA-binding domain
MTPPASPIPCLTDALAKQFPVCHTLLGDEFFRAMAGIFIELSPRCAPVLATYGDDFADFIDSFPLARPLPYLGDVARLEAARTSACQAADAAPLGVHELASFASCQWDQMRLELHPSVRIVRSGYAIVSIWESHAQGGDPSTIDSSVPEDALVARPELEVEIHRLPPGGAVFISELLGDRTLRAAADAAALADPRLDLITTLSRLLGGRIVIGLRNT